MSWPSDLPRFKQEMESANLTGVVQALMEGPLKGVSSRQREESHFWVMGLRELAMQKKLDSRWVELADWESQLFRLKHQGGPISRGVHRSQVQGGLRFVEIHPDAIFLRAEHDWSGLLAELAWWSFGKKDITEEYLACVVPYPGRPAGVHLMRSTMIEILDLFQDGPREESVVFQAKAAAGNPNKTSELDLAFAHLLGLEVLRRIPQEDWRFSHQDSCSKGQQTYVENGLMVTTAMGIWPAETVVGRPAAIAPGDL